MEVPPRRREVGTFIMAYAKLVKEKTRILQPLEMDTQYFFLPRWYRQSIYVGYLPRPDNLKPETDIPFESWYATLFADDSVKVIKVIYADE